MSVRPADTAEEHAPLAREAGAGLNVLMMPDFREGNPYQSLLGKALDGLGVNVAFPNGYRRICPLYRATQEQQPPVDVLHLHWLTPYLRGRNLASYLFYALKFRVDVALVRRRGVRVVWTIHNRISHESRFPRLEMWARRALARAADKIIVHSRAALAELTHELRLNPAKTSVIPHGHYRDIYHPAVEQRAAREALGLPAEGLVYLCFGIVRRYKNIEGLLSVWKSAAGRPTGRVLVLAGEALEPDYAGQVRELARGCPNTIAHLQRIEDERVQLYFSAADIVVLPFQRMLTSGSLLLAMTFDKPVIAPRLAVIAEALGPAGDLLYDPQDERGLAGAIESAARTDLRSLAGRTRRQCDQLAWRAIAQQTSHTYEWPAPCEVIPIT